MTRIEIVEIPPDIVSEIGLQMLVAADRIAGLSARIYAVEMLRTIVKVEAQGREMVVPVGIFDDDLALGIDGVCRAEDDVLRRILHELKAVLGPAPVSLGLDAVFALAVVEKEVVENDFVEEARRVLCDLLGLGALDRVAVAVCLERVGLADGICDAAGDLKSLLLEELDGFLQGWTVDYELVAVSLEIDLVHLHLGGNDVPGGIQPMLVRHPLHLVSAGIDGYLEVLVIGAGLCGYGRSQQCKGCDKSGKVFHGQCCLTTNIRFYWNFRKAMQALCPPKPNELEKPRVRRALTALLGV